MTKTTLTGLYTQLRVGATAGELYVYGAIGDSCSDTLEVSSTYAPPAILTYDGGTEQYTATCNTPNAAGSDFVIEIKFPTGCCTFNYVSQTGWTDAGAVVSIDWDDCAAGNFTLSNTDPAGMDGEEFKRVYFRSNTAFEIVFTLSGTATDAVTKFSDDFAETFGVMRPAGTPVTPYAGFDVAKIGTIALLGIAGQVKKATSGGAWAAYGDPLPSGFVPSALWIPRYQLGSTTTANNGISTPEYVVFSNVVDGAGETMYKVTATGATFTAITPSISAVKGVAVSAGCLSMPFNSGLKIAAVADFGGDIHLVTTVNTGGAWSDRGQIADDALYVRWRRGDLSLLQLFVANGLTDLTVSPSGGVNLISKQSPTTDAILGVEVFG